MPAYILLVGLPLLGLLGILDLGRGIAAPPAVGGEWTAQFTSAACAAAELRQPALSISQSGTELVVTLNDGRGTTFPATLSDGRLSARNLTATVTGEPGERVLQGRITVAGCTPIAFRAQRQKPSSKGGA